jgi:hypothetical protein
MKKILVICMALALSTSALAVDIFTIGTGGVTGSYFPMGNAICRAMNKQLKETELYCNVESTGGSVININNIESGKTEFGFAQSDVVYQAYHGTKQFEGQAYKELRSVMAIYPEVLALVVNKTAGIKTLQDIRGKRINIGNPGSGNEATVMELFNQVGLGKTDLALAGVLKAQDCPDALKDQQIDGYFYMVGHPSANIGIAAESVNIELVPLESESINGMIEHYPYYLKSIIPGGLYPGVESDVPSIGVKAVLVTAEETSDKAVRLIIKTVLDNFNYFKTVHPLLGQKAVTRENLLVGLSAPLHPAAAAYYREVGLLK